MNQAGGDVEDTVTTITSPGPGESVATAIGGPPGERGGYASAWWEKKLLDERAAYEAQLTKLRADSDRLLQRALDAEEQAVRWFKMSKELLAVAGEFAKLLVHP